MSAKSPAFAGVAPLRWMFMPCSRSTTLCGTSTTSFDDAAPSSSAKSFRTSSASTTRLAHA